MNSRATSRRRHKRRIRPAEAGSVSRSGHLWDSYNVLIPVLSKTYASGGTSPANEASPAFGPRNGAQEHPMLDILMLAIAAGLFAAGIGYAYVCERL